MAEAVDLFSGPRGWDVGARMADLPDALGIEWDEAACATSVAAGFPTLRADVSALDPLDFAPCELLIASPPCQAWSMAGKRQGQEDIAHVYEGARALAAGAVFKYREWADPRSRLVLEPLRWALALKPARMAWEQVPPVLEFWEFCADLLRAEGYSVWTGILSAERFGVPQTRRRAILMASLDGPVHPPAPTHQAYVPGEPAREEHTLEGTLLPWVSMAEALGWQEGSGAYRLARGEGMLERHGERRSVPDAEPAPVITSKARTASWQLRANAQANAAVRDAGEPAPTITGGHDTGERVWLPSHMAKKEDRPERKAQGAGNQPRAVETPAATLDTRTDLATWVGCGDPLALKGDDWPDRRPATTVAGDPRVFQPGGHHGEGEQSKDAVRVSLSEALTLQGFPADYPVQGSRTKQFEQVGNAVPPPLAAAILGALTA